MSAPLPFLTPASTAPGLVFLLDHARPAQLPTPADGPLGLTQQLRLEVADFLDARQQADVPIACLTPAWYREFADYLGTFHSDETVRHYLATTAQLVESGSENVLPGRPDAG